MVRSGRAAVDAAELEVGANPVQYACSRYWRLIASIGGSYRHPS